MEIAGNVISQAPEKLRAEMKVGPAEILVVRDGAQIWTYMAATKQYRKTAATAGSTATTGFIDPSVLLGGTPGGLVAARTAPDEDIILDGAPVHCYVVAADYDISQGPAGHVPMRITIWIDQKTFVVLRFKNVSVVSVPQLQGTLETTIDFTFHKLGWTPVLTGSEFVFVPPEGAIEMAPPTPAASKVSGIVRAATLIKRVSPEYPKDAKAAHIEGTVRFTAVLGKDGTVKDLQLVSGHPMLVQAATDAVKQWIYQPTLLNGEPVEVRTQIEVNFKLDALSTPAGVYRIGNGVSAPRVASKLEPHYSEEARIGRLQGTVTVSVVVGEDGRAKNIRVTKSLGLGLDEKAIEAIGLWQFIPGEKEGMPVPILATIQVNFRLVNKAFDNVGQWHLTRASFKPPEEASLPSLIKAKFPHDSSSEDGGSVVVALDVDEQGLPVNIHVEKSSDAQWEEDVMAAAREWRFTPGFKDGAAVVVPLTLEFSFDRNAP
ncbi:MAG: TonB family protein [Acidobacteriota bacterium]|nr:TonB family protein [Acidobacteriota bacterium]